MYTNGYSGHPAKQLIDLAQSAGLSVFSEEFALKIDNNKNWPNYRDLFCYPKKKDLPNTDTNLISDPDNDECIYLSGNSLGLQAKNMKDVVQAELNNWAKTGLYAHHFCGKLPWVACDEMCREPMAKIVGARDSEVYIMNTLTVNLHLLMISFYQPNKERYKIMLEEKAFPSDYYIVESQIKLHNLDPKECIITVKPRENESWIRTKDIIERIEQNRENLALILFSGIQYLTGQYFEIETITKAAHENGCKIGWDLAHAVGNVELKLHDWNVDFAAWCSYKYLNSGAGGISAIFLHENHFNLTNVKKLDGWWSHKLDTRFHMTNNMSYAEDAAAYAVSSPCPLLCAALSSSLDIFSKVGMKSLREKSKFLTAYLEMLLLDAFSNGKSAKSTFEFLTPTDPEQRGAQLSLKFHMDMDRVFSELQRYGIVCDTRKPNVIRVAPVPLYNTFIDCYKFVKILKEIIK